MRKIATLLMLGLIANFYVSAADVYWVGPENGAWSDGNNWSASMGGPGGFGVPGATDSVIINFPASVNVDVSPTLGSLLVTRDPPGGDAWEYSVNLFTTKGCVLTILNYFNIYRVSLTDSTSENVPFNIVLNGATHATGEINGGLWKFTGRVPITAGNGATVTAEPGSQFTVRYFGGIVSDSNSAYINCVPSSLNFAVQSRFIIRSNLDAAIPNATFSPDIIVNPGPVYPPTPPQDLIIIPGPSIYIEGKMGTLKYPSPLPQYKSLSFYLPDQATDASLDLPDSGSVSNIGISNTNGHTITIFNNKPSSITKFLNIGGLLISGVNTKVAMANSTASTQAASYRLQVSSFTQSGGNFSLQDYNNTTGSSTLAVSFNFNQTAGTFITNSTSINNTSQFVLEMNGADLYYDKPYGTASRGQYLTMSSKTIDNGRKNVTLRINTPLYGYNGYYLIDKGVKLTTPLTVGRLDFVKGALNTTDTTLITVTDPSAATGVIQSGRIGESYVVGPIKRMTNSTSPYIFPLGATGIYGINQFYRPSTITPVSATPSVYQTEFINNAYKDLNVTAPLKGVSETEYWNISKISGADASITLPFFKPVTGATDNAIVVAHYVNGHWISEHGTIIKANTTDSGYVTTKTLSAFSPFALGYGMIYADTFQNGYTCLNDTTIVADPNTCKAKVTWVPLTGVFANTYNLSNGDRISLKGVFNGHAYYESGGLYTWPDAKTSASSTGGHLVTITSAAENNFINNSILDSTRRAYTWIGLYNTGKPGQFSWVTGEPLSYTNWIPGEPNNYYNNPLETAIYEPYVHINGFDMLNRWNDIGSINTKFLAEFDSTIFNYRQYSGPANGATVDTGKYTICYERTNRLTNRRDSCCFNISVVCNKATAAASLQHTINAVAYPNPTSSSFLLKFNDYNRTENIRMEVTNAVGKTVEVRNNVGKDSQVLFGSRYTPGIYFTRIIQGNKVIVLKLVKQ